MRLRATTAGLLATGLLAAATAMAGGNWNDAQIGWQEYDKGLAAAKKAK